MLIEVVRITFAGMNGLEYMSMKEDVGEKKGESLR